MGTRWETAMTDQLTTDQAAALAGISPASWREYRRRGTVPGPDGYVGRTPWWSSATIEGWIASRRTRGRPRAGETP